MKIKWIAAMIVGIAILPVVANAKSIKIIQQSVIETANLKDSLNYVSTGTVLSTNANGKTGKYQEEGTGIIRSYVITRPEVYVLPGDSIKVLVETPSNHTIKKGIVIEINNVRV